jgi:hypothetical protein
MASRARRNRQGPPLLGAQSPVPLAAQRQVERHIELSLHATKGAQRMLHGALGDASPGTHAALFTEMDRQLEAAIAVLSEWLV